MKRENKMLTDWLIRVMAELPEPKGKLLAPEEVAIQKMIKSTALRSSSVSAALNIPGGIASFATILPEVATIWKMQSQMVSNIAATYGKESIITREQMLWCMFRQVAIGATKDLVVQQGGRYLVRQIGPAVYKKMLGQVGVGIARTQAPRFLSKALPVIGSVSAGALSYYDTLRVGKSAIQLYSREIELLPGQE